MKSFIPEKLFGQDIKDTLPDFIHFHDILIKEIEFREYVFNIKSKKQIKIILNSLPEFYKNYFINVMRLETWNFNKQIVETLLEYFDIDKFIEMFHRKINEYFSKNDFQIDNPDNFTIHVVLIQMIFNEVRMKILYEPEEMLVFCLEEYKAKYFCIEPHLLKKKDDKLYFNNLERWVKDLNSELLLGISTSVFDGHSKPLKSEPLINNIIDSILRKYQFLLIVGKSKNNLDLSIAKAEIEELKKKQQRNFLHEDDISAINYKKVIEEVRTGKSIYQATKEIANSENIDVASFRSSFNSYCKNRNIVLPKKRRKK